MAKLKQLKCPSCGATLNQSFPNQLIVECPYCHQQVVNETFQNSGKDKEAHILEFSLNEEGVVKTMVDMLIEDQSVPTDIFDKMKIFSITKYYVPMYIFEGSFRAPWTAERPRQEKRQRIGRDGKIENYEETLYDYFNGEATGNFSVNAIPSNEVSQLNLETESIQKIIINPYQLPYFSEVQVDRNDGIITLTPSSESNSVWWESGESSAHDIGAYYARYQAQGYLKSCSVSCELNNSSLVYIPIWEVEYSYNGAKYLFVSYAEQFGTTTKPDADEILAEPTAEQKVVLEKYNKRDDILSDLNNFGCLGCALGVLSLFVGAIFGIKFLEHLADDGYFFKFIFAGLAWLIILWIIRYIFRRIDGIDLIEEDIENRTRILQNEAYNYKKNTGGSFLKHFSGSSGISSDTSFGKEVEKEESYENHNISPFYASSSKSKKFCSHCGKAISDTHKFCRYCGAKL